MHLKGVCGHAVAPESSGLHLQAQAKARVLHAPKGMPGSGHASSPELVQPWARTHLGTLAWVPAHTWVCITMGVLPGTHVPGHGMCSSEMCTFLGVCSMTPRVCSSALTPRCGLGLHTPGRHAHSRDMHTSKY